jgi:hypothetical protein
MSKHNSDYELTELEQICYSWMVDAEDKAESWARLLVAYPGLIVDSYEDFWHKIRHWRRRHKHHPHHPYSHHDHDDIEVPQH